MRILALSLLVPFVVACGGGSGGSNVSSSKKLTELSADEQMDLCEELSFSRDVTCDGSTITIRSKDCATITPPPASCTATVGDARACTSAQMSASDEELCNGDLGTACAKLVACGGGDDGPPQ